MAQITYDAQDGSVPVVFLDPAGVQAAVDAAIAALPPATTDSAITEVDVKEADGDTEVFDPASSATGGA